MDSQKQVLDWIDKNRNAIVGFLQDLIRIPSVTGEEGPIQQFIAGRLKEMGLAVDVFEPDLAALRKHPAFVEVSRGYEGRPNVVGNSERQRGREIPPLQRPRGRDPGRGAGELAA